MTGVNRRSTPRIHLRPLDVSLITIMKSVANAEEFPEPLGYLLHEQTGGNPFFLEEICRTLLKEAIELNRKTGQRLLEGHGLAALGEIYYDKDDADQAQQLFERSLELRRAIGKA